MFTDKQKLWNNLLSHQRSYRGGSNISDTYRSTDGSISRRYYTRPLKYCSLSYIYIKKIICVY